MSTEVQSALDTWLAQARAWVDTELGRVLAESLEAGAPELLVRATEHALMGPGKRLRPALVRLFCESHGGGADLALPAAAAVELLHTYSLVHDDLPCMDGVLVGDALQCAAFESCGRAPEPAASVQCLARAAGAAGMVGGQVIDLRAGERPEGIEGLWHVHALKTAALFAASCELGAIAAGASSEDRARSADYGRALGACFQIVDDVLDVVGDAGTLGKTPGKDARLERDSTVALLGLDGARQMAREWAGKAEQAVDSMGFEADHHARRLIHRLLERQA
ncbi:MAG: polyprenyl synthetase family protein [Planctomycetota bacterium]